jgi:hypothetical protein
MTQKAKSIYILFKGIGIDKIGVVTSSADAISRLINLYTDKLTKSQNLIGVNNCSCARDLPAELNKSESPDVGTSTSTTSQTSIKMHVENSEFRHVENVENFLTNRHHYLICRKCRNNFDMSKLLKMLN